MMLADAAVSIVRLHLLKKEHPEVPLGDAECKGPRLRHGLRARRLARIFWNRELKSLSRCAPHQPAVHLETFPDGNRGLAAACAAMRASECGGIPTNGPQFPGTKF